MAVKTRLNPADLPADATLETYQDGVVWITWDDGRKRTRLSEWSPEPPPEPTERERWIATAREVWADLSDPQLDSVVGDRWVDGLLGDIYDRTVDLAVMPPDVANLLLHYEVACMSEGIDCRPGRPVDGFRSGSTERVDLVAPLDEAVVDRLLTVAHQVCGLGYNDEIDAP